MTSGLNLIRESRVLFGRQYSGKGFYLWEQPIGCRCPRQLSSGYKAPGAASATIMPAKIRHGRQAGSYSWEKLVIKFKKWTKMQPWYRARAAIKRDSFFTVQATAQYRPCFCLVAGDWHRLWWPGDICPATSQCCARTAPFWWRWGGAG